YYIMMGIFSQVGLEKWMGSAAAVGAGIGLIAGPVGFIIGGAIGGAGGYLLGTAFSGDSGHQYLSPTIIEANSKDFSSLNCSSINTLA
ncbi:hypothetical protein LRR18_17850, partial [Mangrovimonas sp. AS39]|uniref:hypothetical protein n=1 Tax=Mangrovimonas futianensis TaxID=2895523 RepID=UPI001E5912C2